MKKILVALGVQDKHKEVLKKAAPDCEFIYQKGTECTDEALSTADIIVGNVIPPSKLAIANKVELVTLESAGADNYVKPGIFNHDVVLTNCTGAYNKPVAEHGLALTLSLQKNLPLYRDNQAQCVWKDHGRVTSISDSIILIVGLGDIGLYYAKLVKALGAYVIGIKRRPSEKPEYVDELYTMEKLDEVIGKADVIFSVLPGTNETYHLYNLDLFKKMKSDAIFVNCGRGSSVDIDGLCEALDRGLIRAAGCDVFEVEPLPSDHRAWKTTNLEITPHRAGFYIQEGTLDAVVNICANNIHAWLNNEPLVNIVDFKTGYKK